ncbi:MAG: hemerythrin family protein [Campylobacterales bacterium]|nr:hemerythrin family protein [Campylobacterales bacterium]
MEFLTDKHLLNFEIMDDLHKEFIEIYNSVEENNYKSYKNVITKLLEQTKRHFSEEEKLMDLYKYPRFKEHKDEHNKVLKEMEYFLKNSHSIFGQKILKSYYTQKLPYWFDLHLTTMDRDLVYFIKEKNS